MTKGAKKKVRRFTTIEVGGIKKALKATTAASIGRTIARHSFLDYLLVTTMAGVMEMNVKHARLVLRVPQGRRYPAVIRDLLAVHKLKPPTQISATRLGTVLDRANEARNILAHSLFVWSEVKKKTYLQVVIGDWALPQEYEPTKRAIQPEAVVPDALFLRAKRKAVEDGIRLAHRYQKLCRKKMKALHEKRRKQAALDRRVRGQTQSK